MLTRHGCLYLCVLYNVDSPLCRRLPFYIAETLYKKVGLISPTYSTHDWCDNGGEMVHMVTPRYLFVHSLVALICYIYTVAIFITRKDIADNFNYKCIHTNTYGGKFLWHMARFTYMTCINESL